MFAKFDFRNCILYLFIGSVWKSKDEGPGGASDEVELRLDLDNGRDKNSDDEFEQALTGAEESDLLDLAGTSMGSFLANLSFVMDQNFPFFRHFGHAQYAQPVAVLQGAKRLAARRRSQLLHG